MAYTKIEMLARQIARIIRREQKRGAVDPTPLGWTIALALEKKGKKK